MGKSRATQSLRRQIPAAGRFRPWRAWPAGRSGGQVPSIGHTGIGHTGFENVRLWTPRPPAAGGRLFTTPPGCSAQDERGGKTDPHLTRPKPRAQSREVSSVRHRAPEARSRSIVHEPEPGRCDVQPLGRRAGTRQHDTDQGECWRMCGKRVHGVCMRCELPIERKCFLLRNVRPCATDGDVDRSSRFPSLDPPHEPARILSFPLPTLPTVS